MPEARKCRYGVSRSASSREPSVVRGRQCLDAREREAQGREQAHNVSPFGAAAMFESTLKVAARSYRYADIRAAIEAFDPNAFERMPFSLRVFAENVARRTSPADAAALLQCIAQ